MTSHTPDPNQSRQVYDTDARDAAVPVEGDRTARGSVVERQKERYGGIKFGSAFFGWLTATGLAVLLTALAGAIAAAVGLQSEGTVEEAADAAADNAGTVGIVGAIIVAVVLLVSYYAGGYVAGRMARFDGAKQGLAVWLWALVIADRRGDPDRGRRQRVRHPGEPQQLPAHPARSRERHPDGDHHRGDRCGDRPRRRHPRRCRRHAIPPQGRPGRTRSLTPDSRTPTKSSPLPVNKKEEHDQH